MKNRVSTEQGSAYSTRSRLFYMKLILGFTKNRQCHSQRPVEYAGIRIPIWLGVQASTLCAILKV
jgi:hypothetical protein